MITEEDVRRIWAQEEFPTGNGPDYLTDEKIAEFFNMSPPAEKPKSVQKLDWKSLGF